MKTKDIKRTNELLTRIQADIKFYRSGGKQPLVSVFVPEYNKCNLELADNYEIMLNDTREAIDIFNRTIKQIRHVVHHMENQCGIVYEPEVTSHKHKHREK